MMMEVMYLLGSFYGEGYPFFSVTRGAANLISEYARFYYSSISKLPSNIALAKQTQGRKEEVLNLSTISIPLLNIVGDQDDLAPSSFINTSE